ncbi:hypothetical protein CONCODRAFT_166323 [Conidiobolus coronatus NRRL 28638]|uniref:Phorbol-ester/DAG-type domain-containing protein n=1 Tax=Conidiobolus coronatus (strain ATCC 28846 / CBS 209.66 / NRRL 28638) TaxID=796925 RepID=A0A137P1D0_CONC2|nr:hypothetical protein CONCODRAFT_166323 [Conidiobolus coronatus NRRL 28638]|eukprot:KXN68684.1 hypothetical protein CONCODRAFT_166323 [Conidiobolus coronatus NRRL 28638]
MSKTPHQFQITTFHKPTYCDYCKGFLWGLILQGYSCQYCNYVCHPRCRLTMLKKNDDSLLCPSILNNALVNSPSDTPSFLTQLFSTAQQHEEYLKKSRDQPVLNLFTTTPQNLTKFLNRVTFMRQTQSVMLTILTWERPKLTWLIIGGYLIFVFYFKAVLILLQLALLSKVALSANRKNIQGSQCCQKELRVQSMLSVKEYALNFQFIQNFMGSYIDLYDTFNNWDYYISKQEKVQKALVYGLPISILATGLGLDYLSFKYLALVAGCGLLLCNHPLVMAILLYSARFIKSDIIENTKIRFRRNSMNEIQRHFYYFENERWWVGLGWQPRTLHLERPNWTLTSLEPLDDPLTPPKGFEWKEESSAIIDYLWCQPIALKNEGWIYSDPQWNHPSNQPYMNSFTRRRLWKRLIVPAPHSSDSASDIL